MFVGWEGVGLSSYLLINFWFTRIQANKAAIKAMLVNRVGDFSLLLAIFAIYFVFNSLDYDTIFSLAPLMLDHKIVVGGIEIPALDMICIFLFIPNRKSIAHRRIGLLGCLNSLMILWKNHLIFLYSIFLYTFLLSLIDIKSVFLLAISALKITKLLV
jgi:hypothetical protein